MAHVIAQKEQGPRGENSLPLSDRDEFDNIIILCPSCHTIIDKNAKLFPVDTLLQWKRNHESSIKHLFEGQIFENKQTLRASIEPLLAENKMIFSEYGPYSENAILDQSATELMWDRLAKQRILPNNRKIEKYIEINIHFLDEYELFLFTRFKIHREGFEYNKISGDVNAVVSRFPNGFENILK